MSDLREPQPNERTLDFTAETWGGHTYTAVIRVSPYSGIQANKVYAAKVEVIFRADDMRRAHSTAQMVSSVISCAHDVWQTNIVKIWEGR